MKALLCGCLVLAMYATPAQAETPAQQPFKVSFADLNLADPVDAELALGRIDRAAHQSCFGDALGARNVRLRRALEACQADAVEAAVTRLKASEVSRQWQLSQARSTQVRTAALD